MISHPVFGEVTDVGYLVFFLLVLLVMAKLDADAVSKGNWALAKELSLSC